MQKKGTICNDTRTSKSTNAVDICCTYTTAGPTAGLLLQEHGDTPYKAVTPSYKAALKYEQRTTIITGKQASEAFWQAVMTDKRPPRPSGTWSSFAPPIGATLRPR